MINWFDMPAEGLSNGGQFEVKELEVTENGTYEQSGEMYNKVTVNVEGGGGSSDFSTATMTIQVIGNTNLISFSNFLTVEGDQGERYFNISPEFVVLEEGVERVVKIPILDGGYMAEINRLVGSITITGEGRYFEDDSYIACIGDCTITIS